MSEGKVGPVRHDGHDEHDGHTGPAGFDGVDGTALSIRVPLEQWVREIVRETAWQVVNEALPKHKKECDGMRIVPTVKENTEKVDRLRIRFAMLVAFMAGSGVLGGAAGAGVMMIMKSMF